MRFRVWDLPTRAFHWLLVLLVVFSVVTAKLGGNWTTWHMRSGYVILTLVLFRIVWGFVGSTPSRFTHFVLWVARKHKRRRVSGNEARADRKQGLGSS